MDYILTEDTILLYPKVSEKGITTVVFEKNRIIEIMKSPKRIIKYNCLKYGSTFEGRRKHSKRLINVSSKTPIIVRESKELIMFPVQSDRNYNCCWINLSNHDLIEWRNEDNFVIKSKSEQLMNLNVSYNIMTNQIKNGALLYYTYFK